MENKNNVELVIKDNIAYILINRSEKMNAVTPDMTKQFHAITSTINADNDVRVVIIKGAGERSFCAGTDVKELDSYKDTWAIRNRKDYVEAVRHIKKPTIAAINGHALGGGLELALNCDIRIAADHVKLGAPEVKLGWHGGDMTFLLPKLLGYGKALKLLLTGDAVNAEEALRIGLVENICSIEDLDKEAMAIATSIASNAPLATQITKHLVYNTENMPLQTASAWQADMQAYCFSTKDAQEGVQAFKEKRKPNFIGE